LFFESGAGVSPVIVFVFQRRSGFPPRLGTLSPSSALSSTEGGFSDPPLDLLAQEIVFLMEKWRRRLACDLVFPLN
jgi:glycogen debranching enzyme